MKLDGILGRMGFQRELHLGAVSVRLDGWRVEMAACSVRSK